MFRGEPPRPDNLTGRVSVYSSLTASPNQKQKQPSGVGSKPAKPAKPATPSQATPSQWMLPSTLLYLPTVNIRGTCLCRYVWSMPNFKSEYICTYIQPLIPVLYRAQSRVHMYERAFLLVCNIRIFLDAGTSPE